MGFINYYCSCDMRILPDLISHVLIKSRRGMTPWASSLQPEGFERDWFIIINAFFFKYRTYLNKNAPLSIKAQAFNP